MPIGSILPYKGSLDDIPENWALCDGTNGTPDLRDRFITGAGNTYDLGDTGGENFHQLTVDEMPKHNHKVIGDNSHSGGNGRAGEIGSSSDGSWFYTEYSGSDIPHENRPPYYALFYIMRIK